MVTTRTTASERIVIAIHTVIEQHNVVTHVAEIMYNLYHFINFILQ